MSVIKGIQIDDSFPMQLKMDYIILRSRKKVRFFFLKISKLCSLLELAPR